LTDSDIRRACARISPARSGCERSRARRKRNPIIRAQRVPSVRTDSASNAGCARVGFVFRNSTNCDNAAEVVEVRVIIATCSGKA
jgi:hypothetical protein